MKVNPFALPEVLRGKSQAKYWWIFIGGFVLVGIVIAPLLMFPLVFIVGISQGVPLFNDTHGSQLTGVYIISGAIVALAWLVVLHILRHLSRAIFFLMAVSFALFILGYLFLSLSFVMTDYLGLLGAIVMLWSYWIMSGPVKQSTRPQPTPPAA